jgi:hypothetical protein
MPAPALRSGSIYNQALPIHLWFYTRCPLTKPVVTAVELQATTEPHCLPTAAEACSPAVFARTSVQREPTGRACAKAAGAFHVSCRLGSVHPGRRTFSVRGLSSSARGRRQNLNQLLKKMLCLLLLALGASSAVPAESKLPVRGKSCANSLAKSCPRNPRSTSSW